MLESIYIENFAIIDQLQIDFHDQMTVLTGETGAGKSIIIDAIGQLYIVLCQTYRKRPSSKFMKRFPEQDWHDRDLRNTPMRRRF